MSVSVYRIGLRHGLLGIKFLSHRKGRPYNGDNDKRSYENGFRHGKQQTAKTSGD